MSTVYIGIGSNLGDRELNCRRCEDLILQRGVLIKKESSIYETEPWGVKDQPLFLNMAIEIETDLGPDDLLKMLKDVEDEMGRGETFHWGPRIIDLDILLFDDLVVEEEDLKIPHPYLHLRDFVLKPLSEIAEHVRHPVFQLSMGELFQRLKTTKSN
jgi:dihydroneopterin aldolase / 2-amino-4-hydroxy-6-hydroxymethyldihydropteridine diphosphokinase